jgi:hypothetical protein
MACKCRTKEAVRISFSNFSDIPLYANFMATLPQFLQEKDSRHSRQYMTTAKGGGFLSFTKPGNKNDQKFNRPAPDRVESGYPEDM